MSKSSVIVPPEETARQRSFMQRVRLFLDHRDGAASAAAPLAYIRTFGCQQNVADSERLGGMLAAMGYGFTDSPDRADLILFNTCAVREHAEDRVFGNVGALKAVKRERPGTVIALCGCMVEQEHAAARLKNSYPFVGLVFGPQSLHRFPELLHGALAGGRRVVEVGGADALAEDIPVRREGRVRAWLPIMYGCDNFCTYCVVPHVRGRERSREPERILAEARELAEQGFREITLLGQNVNSYGRGEAHGMDFPRLLRALDAIPGDFLIRFMTSHPKDATDDLIDAIADCPKVERHFHLPFQSGSNRILAAMNRRYTREDYLALVERARAKIPDIGFTSDVIVGFPGETREDFEQTLDLIRRVRFTSLFTFIYSPRKGTPAAELDDPIPPEEKTKWFLEMTALQETVAAERSAALVGSVRRALLESAGDGYMEARLSDHQVVRVPQDGGADIGAWADVEITGARSWILEGRIVGAA